MSDLIPQHEINGIEMKRGMRAFDPEGIKLKFSDYVVRTQLPSLPKGGFGHVHTAAPPGGWGVLGNNKHGDCLTEGTMVRAPKSGVICRANYFGPVVTITTASGKRLSVTPNHAVLSARGFVCVSTIKKGDDLVSAGGSEPSGLMGHFNDPPAPIEQVFAARSRIERQSMMTARSVGTAYDFNGDELFIKGDVEVVGADRFLHSELGPALGEPNTQNEVVLAGKLQRAFHRTGTALQTFLRSWFATLGAIGGQGYGLPFGFAHSGIAQSQGLGLGTQSFPSFNNLLFQMPSGYMEFSGDIKHRRACDIFTDGSADVPVLSLAESTMDFSVCPSELKASFDKPTRDSGPTDPQLVANLVDAYPGLIKLDRVINVDVQCNVRTHIYDLSSPARWYIAQDIISHNCVMAGAAHETMHWFWATRRPIPRFTDEIVLRQYYERSGGADSGLDPVANAAWRRNVGITDADGVAHKIDAYVRVTDLDDLELATYLFGATAMCWFLPKSAEHQFAQGHVWDDLSYPPDPNAGHYTSFVGRNSRGQLQFLTWGRVHGATRAYAEKYMVGAGCIAYLSREYLLETGKSPEAIAWNDLQSDLQSVIV